MRFGNSRLASHHDIGGLDLHSAIADIHHSDKIVWHGNRLVRFAAWGRAVKPYRINKVAKPGGAVLKKKDVLAASDKEALHTAKESPDCPVCDVLRDGQPVGSIV